MSVVARIVVELQGNISDFSRKMKQAGVDMGKLEKRAKKMSKIVAAATVGAVVLSVKAFADFDAAMTESIAIMGDVSEVMQKKMATAAREMALVTTFSANQTAASFFFLASAGLDAESSIAALPRVARFAEAGMFDMARATDLLTDAQSALGLTIRNDAIKNMENMTKVADVLVKANTLANASVEQFAESLTTRAGAALKLVGKDIEEGVAVLAAFADQGVKGAEAGTRLDIVFRDLQRRAIQNVKAFRENNIAVFDTAGEMRNIADIIGDLERRLDGMSDAQKRATIQLLGFSDRSVSSLLLLVGMSDQIREYEIALRQAGGTTDEVAHKQLETFNAQLKLMKSRLIDVGITVGAFVTPALNKLVVASARIPAGFIIATIAMGGLVAAMVTLAFVLPNIVAGFGLLVGVLGILAAPAALLAIAVAAGLAVAGLLAFKSAMDEAAAASRAARQVLQQTAGLTAASMNTLIELRAQGLEDMRREKKGLDAAFQSGKAYQTGLEENRRSSLELGRAIKAEAAFLEEAEKAVSATARAEAAAAVDTKLRTRAVEDLNFALEKQISNEAQLKAKAEFEIRRRAGELTQELGFGLKILGLDDAIALVNAYDELQAATRRSRNGVTEMVEGLNAQTQALSGLSSATGDLVISELELLASRNEAARQALKQQRTADAVEAFIRGGESAVNALRRKNALLDAAFEDAVEKAHQFGLDIADVHKQLVLNILNETTEGVRNISGLLGILFARRLAAQDRGTPLPGPVLDVRRNSSGGIVTVVIENITIGAGARTTTQEIADGIEQAFERDSMGVQVRST